MANMLILNLGRAKLGAWMFNGWSGAGPDFTLRLYTAVAGGLTVTSIASDFSEATFTGYSALTLTRSEFTIGTSGGVYYATRSPVPTFSCTGGSPETVLGWVLESNDDGTAICAQAFDTSRSMAPGYSELLDPFRIAITQIP